MSLRLYNQFGRAAIEAAQSVCGVLPPVGPVPAICGVVNAAGAVVDVLQDAASAPPSPKPAKKKRRKKRAKKKATAAASAG